MSTWLDARKTQEEFRQTQWGITIEFNGLQATCEGTSPEARNEMQRTSLMPERPVSFTLLNADFTRLGISLRSVVKSGGYEFQVFAINDDPADATVDIRCTLNVSSRK